MAALRLLVSTSDCGGHHLGDISSGGQAWRLVSFDDSSDGDIPDYVCISYSWGPERSAHPLFAGSEMPARTLRVLNATNRALAPRAVWIDAFSVPPDDPDRSDCIRSMGRIYRAATTVVVVMSPAVAPIVDLVAANGDVGESALYALETDEWVSRAWTYQELVNGEDVVFISETDPEDAISARRLFDAVGKALEHFRTSHDLDPWKLRELNPRLDALESLIADWESSNFIERSAFQILSAMVNRHSYEPSERFYAMIGALTTDRPSPADLQLPAGEYFMQLCERKGDFSFIYSSGERGSPSWRPTPDGLRPVMPWHTVGDRQEGQRNGTDLRLDHMSVVDRGDVDERGVQFVRDAAHALGIDRDLARAEIPAAVLRSLRRGGFEGQGDHVEVECGYVFPDRSLPPLRNVHFAIANDISWAFGSPALVITDTDDGVARVVGAAVFVGRPPGQMVSLTLG